MRALSIQIFWEQKAAMGHEEKIAMAHSAVPLVICWNRDKGLSEAI